MATLRVLTKDGEQQIECNDKTNLLEALRANNLYIKSSCGGVASCSDCIIKIKSGEDHLNPPPFEEIKLLGNVFHITKERLSCQTTINGDVTIDITSHIKANDEAKLRQKTSSSPRKTVIRKTGNDLEKERAEREQKQSEQSEVPAKPNDRGGKSKPKHKI